MEASTACHMKAIDTFFRPINLALGKDSFIEAIVFMITECDMLRFKLLVESLTELKVCRCCAEKDVEYRRRS